VERTDDEEGFALWILAEAGEEKGETGGRLGHTKEKGGGGGDLVTA
jgi:hypothetical protein